MWKLDLRAKELFHRIPAQTNAGTAVNVVTPTCPANELWEVTALSLDNESGESVTAIPLLQRTSSSVLVGASASVTNANGTSTNIVPLVGEGEAIGYQVTGTADKGVVTLVVSGWIHQARHEPAMA